VHGTGRVRQNTEDGRQKKKRKDKRLKKEEDRNEMKIQLQKTQSTELLNLWTGL
jgi:hypothetical protein